MAKKDVICSSLAELKFGSVSNKSVLLSNIKMKEV